MSVVVAVEDTGVCRKQLTIEVPPEEVAAATRQVVGQYARNVRVPGFRAGKVPADLVRRRYREDVDRDVVERLVPQYWERAREEQGLDPLGQPQLKEVGDVAEGAPLRFVAVVEVRPTIELGDLDGFDLPEPPTEPAAAEVDEALEELRRRAGEWKDVERPAARGDLVALRIREEGGAEASPPVEAPEAPEAPEADAEQPGVAWQSVDVEVGDPRVWEELSLAVSGLAAGQRGRFTRPPEGGSEAQPKRYELEVAAVRERELAPLDDDFARQVGEFEDVDGLRQAVVANLVRGKREERDQKRREALLEQLRTRHPVPLPEGVVDAEVERMVHDFAHDLQHRGIDPRQAQVEWDKLAGELRGPATRRVHERLLLDAVAEREGLVVAGEEVEGLVAAIAKAEKAPVERVREALGGPATIASRLRRDKALRHLLGDDGPGAEPTDETEAAATASEG